MNFHIRKALNFATSHKKLTLINRFSFTAPKAKYDLTKDYYEVLGLPKEATSA